MWLFKQFEKRPGFFGRSDVPNTWPRKAKKEATYAEPAFQFGFSDLVLASQDVQSFFHHLITFKGPWFGRLREKKSKKSFEKQGSRSITNGAGCADKKPNIGQRPVRRGVEPSLSLKGFGLGVQARSAVPTEKIGGPKCLKDSGSPTEKRIP